jgi:hypothetical protein
MLLVGCVQDSTMEPENPTSSSPYLTPSIGPLCQLGCIETDLNPNEPGVFLGSGVDDELCFNGSQTDNDDDGLSTFCEKNLAVAFAPELWYASNDELGREPKWVAQRLLDGGEASVRVMYLLSYYTDIGTTEPPCSVSSPCYAHYGDSEWIALDLYYNEGTHHWVLDKAYYSAHDGMNVYGRIGNQEFPLQLTYPSHPGAYPLSWVAFGKHANYASQSECDLGGAFGYDHCSLANTGARVDAGNNLNLGSRWIHSGAQNCWSSTNPVLKNNGVQECYWTYRRFSGWSGLTPNASAYTDHLLAMGF